MLESEYLFCCANGAVALNGFTDGKAYLVMGRHGYQDKVVSLVNDNGHERYEIPGELSPHLVDRRNRAVGVFLPIAEYIRQTFEIDRRE